MSNWSKIDIVGGHNPSRYIQVSNEQLSNLFISTQKTGDVLFSYAGFQKINDFIPSSNPRGIFFSSVLDTFIVAFDKYLYRVNTISEPPQVLNPETPLSGETGTVYFAESIDTKQLVFSAGGALYVLEVAKGNQFSKIFLPNSALISNIVYNDQAFIVVDTNSSRWYVSAVNDATIWLQDELPIEGRVDSQCVGVASLNHLIIVFGVEETEVFEDVGSFTFPYQRNRSYSINYGCLNEASIASGFGLVCWLGGNSRSTPIIMVFNGAKAIELSNDNIDSLLSDLKNPEICEGFIFQEDGHIFYQINWPLDGLSLAYDFSGSNFIKIAENEKESSVFDIVNFRNSIFALRRGKKGVYQFSGKISSFDGEEVTRIRVTPNYYYETPVTYNEIRLRMQSGIDKSSSSGKDISGALIFKGLFSGASQLSMAKKNDYWVVETEENVFNTSLKKNDLIICTNDVSGTPENFSHFKIQTSQKRGLVRVSLSHDYGVTFNFLEDIPLADFGERLYYIISLNGGSSRTWTFKFEVISTLPIAILGCEARVSGVNA